MASSPRSPRVVDPPGSMEGGLRLPLRVGRRPLRRPHPRCSTTWTTSKHTTASVANRLEAWIEVQPVAVVTPASAAAAASRHQSGYGPAIIAFTPGRLPDLRPEPSSALPRRGSSNRRGIVGVPIPHRFGTSPTPNRGPVKGQRWP